MSRNNPRRDQEAAEIIEELVRLHSLQTNLFARLNVIRLEEQQEERQLYNRPRSNWSQVLGHNFRIGDYVRIRHPGDNLPDVGFVTRVNGSIITVQGRRGPEFSLEHGELAPEVPPNHQDEPH